MNLLEKAQMAVDRFAGGDPYTVIEVKGWLEQAKKLMVTDSLKEVEGIKFLITKFETRKRQVEDMLLVKTSSELPHWERDLLILERELCNDFLSLFEVNKKQMEQLDKLISDNMV